MARSICTYIFSVCLVCSIFCCWSCSSRKTTGDAIVIKFDIDGKGINVPVRQSEFYDSVWYVKLDSCINLYDIYDGKLYNDKFYILDGTNERIITVDTSGHSEILIDHRGRAKDEYLSIFKYDINYGNGQILIYDQAGDKILTYDKNGKYIRGIDLRNLIHKVYRDFAVFSNGNIVGCYLEYDDVEGADETRGVLMFDSLGNFIKRLYHPDPKIKYNLVTNEHFCKVAGNLISFLPEIGNDTIYHFTEDGETIAKYVIDCGLRIDRDFLEKEYTSPNTPSPDNFYGMKFRETSNRLFAFVCREVSHNSMELKATICYDKKNGIPHVIFKDEDYIRDMNVHFIVGSSGNVDFGILYPRGMQTDIVDSLFPALKDYPNPVIQVARHRQ